MTRRFIDTHCHFDFPPFTGNEGSALDLAAQAGVEKIIVPAVDETRFGIVLDLAARYPALYAALGLHPIVIENHTEAALAELERRLVQRPEKLVAIGEIGLDLYREDPQFDRQEWFLDRQLQLAKRYDLPVILHSRRTGVVHGFAGSLQQAERFIALGYKIGVGGTITYPRASKTRDVMTKLPLEALLLETDAPDMPLNGWQGQPNRPERIALVFDTLCELRREAPEDIAAAIRENTLQVFDLQI